MLSVDERVILFAIMLAVREGHLDIFAFEMNDWIANFLGGCLTGKEIEQSIFGMKNLAVIFDF